MEGALAFADDSVLFQDLSNELNRGDTNAVASLSNELVTDLSRRHGFQEDASAQDELVARFGVIRWSVIVLLLRRHAHFSSFDDLTSLRLYR